MIIDQLRRLSKRLRCWVELIVASYAYGESDMLSAAIPEGLPGKKAYDPDEAYVADGISDIERFLSDWPRHRP
jgi:hypothetical protein